MSETNAEAKTENNLEAQEKVETTPRKGKRTSSIASKLAKEAESILKGFGDKEDAPEGRRTTRSSTRGSIAPPVCTPPPAKKERKSSASSNNLASGTRRGRPKKGGGDDIKPNSDEPKEESNSVEEMTDIKEADKVNDVADVEMKDENIANVESGSGVAPTTDVDEADVKKTKAETNLEASVDKSTATSGDGNDKSNDANATVVPSGLTPSSAVTVTSNSSSPSMTAALTLAPVAITSNVSSVSFAATTTANGTVENACKRINRDDKIVDDSTGAIDSDDVAKKVSLGIDDEKTAPAAVGETTSSTTTTASTFSEESNKSLNNSSETSANQTSVTLSSND